jgi:hypothetical protein
LKSFHLRSVPHSLTDCLRLKRTQVAR